MDSFIDFIKYAGLFIALLGGIILLFIDPLQVFISILVIGAILSISILRKNFSGNGREPVIRHWSDPEYCAPENVKMAIERSIEDKKANETTQKLIIEQMHSKQNFGNLKVSPYANLDSFIINAVSPNYGKIRKFYRFPEVDFKLSAIKIIKS